MVQSLEGIRSRLGLIQVYTGNGKGKSTAAYGLALRAAGHGLRVQVVEFLKGDGLFGEVEAARHLPNLQVRQFGAGGFAGRDHSLEESRESVRQAYAHAIEAARGGEWDLLVLDEINVALHKGLLAWPEVEALLRGKAPRTEVILTGRYADPRVLELADLVTEMKEVKHPFHKGVHWRWGIER